MTKLTQCVVGLIFNLIWAPSFAATLALPENLIAYNSPAGKKLLIDSVGDEYLQLGMQFLTQKNQAYCGVASIVMVLNALNVAGPNDPIYSPFQPFTQDNFFTPAVEKVIDSQQVSHHGMTLDQAALVTAQFQVTSQAIHSDSLTLDKMRKRLRTVLESKEEYAIVNFFRPGLKEQGGGHFSPVAAYDAASDRFLILDVARYKYPPIWVKAADLWQAIDTIDSDNQKKRGILLIKRSF